VNRCRRCQKTWRGGSGWRECEHCGEFSGCPDCSKNPVLLAGHEKYCMRGGAQT
jgi:hypothetical protein